MWPLISGANATSPRTEVILGMPTMSSAESIGDPYTGVQALIRSDGYKLIIRVSHQNVWTGPKYPNASTAWPNTPEDCGDMGCLFNVFDDPSEYHNIAASHPNIVSAMRERIAYHNSTMYRPDRGVPETKLACQAIANTWGGFWGPWL